MTPYIIMHFFPFIYLYNIPEVKKYFLKFFIFFTLIIFVGLRHNVGGDWFLYVEAGRNATVFKSIDDTILSIIYLISYELLNTGIYGVNIISSIILFYALSRFLKLSPHFELGMFILYPIIIVTGLMGYLAQSISLAFGLISLTFLIKREIIFYIFLLF